MNRRILTGLVTLAALVIGAAAWFFGLDVPHSAMIAFAVAAVALTWLAVQEGDAPVWPQSEHRITAGTRRDLQSLGWSMKTRGGVHEATLGRARETARHRLLFLYGLDLYDPADRDAVERVLAPWAVKLLLTARHATLDLTTFTRCLSAVQALGKAPDAGSATPPAAASGATPAPARATTPARAPTPAPAPTPPKKAAR